MHIYHFIFDDKSSYGTFNSFWKVLKDLEKFQAKCGVNVFWNMLIYTHFLLGVWQSKLSRSFWTIRKMTLTDRNKIQPDCYMKIVNGSFSGFYASYKQVIWWWIGNKLFSKAVWKVDPQRWRFRFPQCRRYYFGYSISR